ncbi:MAG TPA: 50S ribosome-binding GTPase, partial [Bacillota bacterium]|nr:50S ribosome-binding GTPase [Bacillota bacterium]
AVILNQRRIRPGSGLMKLFKKPVYEIVAATDEMGLGEGIPIKDTDDGYVALEEKLDRLKATMDTIANSITPADKDREIPEMLAPYHLAMEKSEVDPEVIHMVMEGVKNKINLNTTYDQEYIYYRFKQEISSYFKRVETIQLKDGKYDEQCWFGTFQGVETIQLKDGKPAVAVFVGPTGVGKTTTLAKLAAHYSVIMKKKVGVMTCDTYRIAAVEQLKTYSEIMDVPIRVIYQKSDIEEAMQQYKDMDLVLVDTAGSSYRDKMKLMELNKMLKALGDQQLFLVISASTNYRNVMEILSSYSFLKNYKVLITKVDENVSNGIILNIAVKSGKPLSYITTGQSVPDDIEKVDGERIASLILSDR